MEGEGRVTEFLSTRESSYLRAEVKAKQELPTEV